MNKITISSTLILTIAVIFVQKIITNSLIESFLIYLVWIMLSFGIVSYIILLFALNKMQFNNGKVRIEPKKVSNILIFKKTIVHVVNIVAIYSFYIKNYQNLAYFMLFYIVIGTILEHYFSKLLKKKQYTS